jgi:hypothetical protein
MGLLEYLIAKLFAVMSKMGIDASKSFQNSRLHNLIPFISRSYRSADIRAILVRGSGGEQWRNAFLKIRFVKDPEEEVHELHKIKVNSLGDKINNDRFKIVFETRSSAEALSFLDDIQEMQLNLKTLNLNVRLLETDYQNIYENDKRFDIYQYYTTKSEICGYIHKCILINSSQSPANIINQFINLDDYDLNYDDLNNYFDAESLFHSNHSGVIYFPHYCKIVDTTQELGGEYFSIAKMHRSLIEDSKAIVRIKNNRKEINFIDCRQELGEDGFAEVYVPIAIRKFDELNIQVKHKILGILVDIRSSNSTYQNNATPAGTKVDQYMTLPIERLLGMEESNELEFKPRLILEDKPNKQNRVQLETLQDIGSFMNMENGGVVVLGITNDREVCGIDADFNIFPPHRQNIDNWIQHIDNVVESHIGGYYLQYMRIEKEINNKRTVVRIRIVKGQKPAYVTYEDFNTGRERTEFYIRSNGRSIPLNGLELFDYTTEHWH